MLAGANPEDLSENGSPLHSAARMGHHEVAKCLISNMKSVNLTDKEGVTPLHNAVQ